ncbi:molybdenum cofactor biosynthesis protein MoaE [Herbiconiux sp. P15]|uniref:molybdenum cofactor biosynthesis protein MoaE n=1 Tax=Herbiconiux liukaitaii TaxID=3342799 RepID=UPI0035B899C5
MSATTEPVGGESTDGSVDAGPADGSAVRLAVVSSEAISVEECIAAVSRAHAGAVVSFAGVVRDHDEGKGVEALSYTAHPSAGDAIEEAARRIAAAHPQTVVAVAHRVGDLVVGDIALACAVSSAHRSEAFAACSALVDLVKQTVPIWKEQSFDDGSTEWVASLG